MQASADLGQPGGGAYGICRARVTVNGLPVIACIDSGASSSMIPLHTVKRANLLHRVSKESQLTFLTADGHEARGHGLIPGLGVHIGGDTLMKVDATVSKAGNYDLLLGNDFLGPLKATMDFSRGRLYFQKDETTTEFVELQFNRPTVAAMVMK
jgi:predicted aspartyl protease